MKKLFLAIATVAMLFATSCNKENNNPAVNPEDIPDGSFLCTIDNGAMPQNAPRISDGMTTMTWIDENDDIYWVSDDTITINSSTYSYQYASDKGVYFTPTSTEATAPYHAFYPSWIGGQNSNQATLPSAIEAYINKDIYNLPMYAYSESSKLLTFHNICAVLEIKMPDFGTETCNKIIVSADQDLCGAFTVNSNFVAVLDNQTGTNNTITVDRKGNASKFTKDELVYVPIPAGSYTNFKFTFNNGTTLLYETPTQSISVVANKIYPVTINYTPPTPPTPAPITNPFCFEPVSGTATIRLSGNGTAPSLEYRLNNSTDAWQTFNVNQDYQVTYPNTLCIRATSTATNNCFASTTDGTSYYHFTCTGTNVKVKGYIAYLLHNNPNINNQGECTKLSIDDYEFSYLFEGMTNLTDASELKLPMNYSNTKGLFQGLFKNCTTLTSVPHVGNSEVEDYCYREMFMNCAALYAVTMDDFTADAFNEHTDVLEDWLKGAGGTAGGTLTVPSSIQNSNSSYGSKIAKETPTTWAITNGGTGSKNNWQGTKQP